ncbi:hypothetical protein [Pseudomonas aeruginosa]|uniref:hypothetical protein n=1 Tax=Pseudomonas aeruginosa TaxID=287 RepID=UPI00053F0606|nr:hypothetical protein [Pseudomonas aeruginosa]
MKYSLSSKVIFPWGGTGGELGGAARTTLPGPGLGADGELGVAARITLPRIDLGADGELGDAARITLPGPGLDNDEWPIDFTELQELSELLGKLKSCVDVAIDNAPEGAKS